MFTQTKIMFWQRGAAMRPWCYERWRLPHPGSQDSAHRRGGEWWHHVNSDTTLAFIYTQPELISVACYDYNNNHCIIIIFSNKSLPQHKLTDDRSSSNTAAIKLVSQSELHSRGPTSLDFVCCIYKRRTPPIKYHAHGHHQWFWVGQTVLSWKWNPKCNMLPFWTFGFKSTVFQNGPQKSKTSPFWTIGLKVLFFKMASKDPNIAVLNIWSHITALAEISNCANVRKYKTNVGGNIYTRTLFPDYIFLVTNHTHSVAALWQAIVNGKLQQPVVGVAWERGVRFPVLQ